MAVAALFVLILCFPTGQVYPRWAAPWLWLLVTVDVITVIIRVISLSPGGSVNSAELTFPLSPFFVPALAPYYTVITGPIGQMLSLPLKVLPVVLLISRYRASAARDRQQIK